MPALVQITLPKACTLKCWIPYPYPKVVEPAAIRIRKYPQADDAFPLGIPRHENVAFRSAGAE